MRDGAGQAGGNVAAVDESVLPVLSRLLDGLLDSAALARPGTDAERHAGALRDAALQVSALAALVQSVVPLAQALERPRRMSA